MAKKKQILYPVVFMMLITAFFTAVLAYINASSIDLIKEQELLRIQRSVLYVLNIPYEDDDASVKSAYEKNVKTATLDNQVYYLYEINGETQGYAFQFSGKGLWGTITGFIAISPDFEKIMGVDFISHSETPGLGGRIDEEWFKNQFRELSITGNSSVIFKPADGGNVDAVTGATLTSNAVRDMINAFLNTMTSQKQEVIQHE